MPLPTSKHVGTATELTVLMDIKPGFLPTFETRSYATRLHALFKVLQQLRTLSREARLHRPLLDVVDAAHTVHSFNWTITPDQKRLILTVNFDRPWEPYIRVIWSNLGALMDLILCNCVAYTPSTAGYDTFAEFVRRHQIETDFFYPASSLTVDDARYLAALEAAQRTADGDLAQAAIEFTAPGPK